MTVTLVTVTVLQPSSFSLLVGIVFPCPVAQSIPCFRINHHETHSTSFFHLVDIVFELPSNLIIKKVGARNLITAISILWGISVLGMGFITHYSQLYALRCLLGLFEAGMFPAVVLLISSWYTRWETQVGLLFGHAVTVRVFADLLATSDPYCSILHVFIDRRRVRQYSQLWSHQHSTRRSSSHLALDLCHSRIPHYSVRNHGLLFGRRIPLQE